MRLLRDLQRMRGIRMGRIVPVRHRMHRVGRVSRVTRRRWLRCGWLKVGHMGRYDLGLPFLWHALLCERDDQTHKQVTYALQFCEDILGDTEIVKLWLNVPNNVVDDGAVDGGLDDERTVIKRTTGNAIQVSSSPQSYSTSRSYAPGTVDHSEHEGGATGGERRGQGRGIYRRLRLREEGNSGSNSAQAIPFPRTDHLCQVTSAT